MLAEEFKNVLNEILVHHCFATINVPVNIIFSPSVSIFIYFWLSKGDGLRVLAGDVFLLKFN